LTCDFHFFYFNEKFYLDTFPTDAFHYLNQIVRSIRGAILSVLYAITKV